MPSTDANGDINMLNSHTPRSLHYGALKPPTGSSLESRDHMLLNPLRACSRSSRSSPFLDDVSVAQGPEERRSLDLKDGVREHDELDPKGYI